MTHHPFLTVLVLSLSLLAPLAQAVTCAPGTNIQPSNPDIAYSPSADGSTVTHKPTGLIWKRCAEGQTGSSCSGSATTHTWAQALSLASTSSFAGQTDWRLPNLKELRSLVEECRSNPSINDTIFPAVLTSWDFWSGSPYAGNSNESWVVSFDNGYVGYGGRNNSAAVRLVRGGQSFSGFDGGGGTTLPTVSGPPTNPVATPGNTQASVTFSSPSSTGSSAITSYTVTSFPGNITATGSASPITVTGLTNGQSYTFTVKAANAVGASVASSASNSVTPVASTMLLDIARTGTGGGSVISSPYGISCGSACSAFFSNGAIVTLTATPDSGNTFIGWSGACTNVSGPCTVSMDAAKSVGAGFSSSVRIELAAAWISPGETTNILTLPRRVNLTTCSTSNSAIAKLTGSAVVGVSRGDAVITCDGASTPVKVRLPWVTDISPKQATVGVNTVFTVKGQDLHTSYLNFVLPNCIGEGVMLAEFGLPTTWSLQLAPQLVTRKFVCLPTAVGVQAIKVHSMSAPSSNYADKRLSPAGTSPAGFGNPDCALSNSCTVEFLSGGAITDRAAVAAVMDSILAPYLVDGKVLWYSLTEEQLSDIGARFKAANVSTQLPAAWSRAMLAELAAQKYHLDIALTDIAGKAAVEGYTWRDSLKLEMYTGWSSTTFGAYTGEDWLKLSGGIALNGTIAVTDAFGLGEVLAATKLGTAAGKVMGKMRALPSMTKIAKMAKKLDSAKKLSALLEVGTAGWNAWGEQDNVGIELALSASSIAIAEKLALSTFLKSKSGVMDEQLTKIASKFIAEFGINFIAGAIQESKDVGTPLSADEIISFADVLASVGDAGTEAAISATPIVGAWVDMGKLSRSIADRAFDRYFENTDVAIAASKAQDVLILNRYRIQNYIRIYESALATSGTDNLNIKPPFLSAGFPQAWSAGGFAASVKRLVFVTHGWNAAAMDWPSDFMALTCQRYGANVISEISDKTPHITGIAKWCKSGDLLIASYNWKDDAELFNYRDGTTLNLGGRSPTTALANAQWLGEKLGSDLEVAGIRPTFSHMIAHSAGSGLIEQLAGKLKLNNPSGTRHLTFLDAYCPAPANCNYGANGTWAEQYLHSLESAFRLGVAVLDVSLDPLTYANGVTDATLPNAYNFDVTRLADLYWPPTSHAFPYIVYLKSSGSATAPTSNLSELGAHLAQEFGTSFSIQTLSTTYPIGKRCVISKSNLSTKGRNSVDGDCESVEAPYSQSRVILAPTYQSIYSKCDSPVVPNPGTLTSSSCLTPAYSQPRFSSVASRAEKSAEAFAVTKATGNTRVATLFAGAANTISFNYQFLQAPQGTVAQVFVDDQLVLVTASDTADSQIKTAKNIGFLQIGAGLHYIQVVIRSGTADAATLQLTNIKFELVNRSISSIDAQAPTVATALQTTVVSSNSISLIWSPAKDNVAVASYKIYRNGVLIATLGNVVGYLDKGVKPSTNYAYTVMACDAAGNCSAQSSPAAATTVAAGTPTCTLTANPTVISAGDLTVLTANCIPAATEYLWTYGYGSLTTSYNSISNGLGVSTTFTVTGSNAFGSGAAASAFVYVCNTPPSATFPGLLFNSTVGNVFYSTLGNDMLTGGEGIDTVIYSCNRDSFTVTKTPVGWIVSSPIEGIDTLTNVDRIQFGDRTLALDISGNAGQAYRIYQAAFNRTPDNGGLKYWINRMDTGTSLVDVAGGFVYSDEFRAMYGTNPTNAEFLTKLYNNVLHRAPEPEGFAWWLGQLDSGAYNKVTALVGFSESPENQAGVINAIMNGIDLLNPD